MLFVRDGISFTNQFRLEIVAALIRHVAFIRTTYRSESFRISGVDIVVVDEIYLNNNKKKPTGAEWELSPVV